MKNLISLSLLIGSFLIVSHGAYSQINFQAGLNSASIKFSVGNESIETGSLTSFHFGANYRKRISSSLFFAPGILFTQKGAKIDGFSEELSFKINYLEVPVILVYQADANKGLFIEGGPYLSYLLSIDAGGEDEEGFTSIDFGIGIGVGYDFGNFLLGLRNSLGLSSIADEENIVDEPISAKNNAIMLYGAYKF